MDGFVSSFPHPRIVAFPIDNAPLCALCGEPSASRFHGWRGSSGRRYVTSVHAVDLSAPDAGLPDLDAFVLIAAQRIGPVARPVAIVALEHATQRRAIVAQGLAAGATEWHVHLLADSRRDRTMAAADLDERHGAPVRAARSA